MKSHIGVWICLQGPLDLGLNRRKSSVSLNEKVYQYIDYILHIIYYTG